MGWGIDFPYPDTKNYVITKKQELQDAEHVEFISESHIDFIRELKKQDGKDIWLIGGGQINTLLLNEGLIDEIQVFVMPIVLSGGIELFGALPTETKLKLVESKTHSTGVVEMKYEVND